MFTKKQREEIEVVRYFQFPLACYAGRDTVGKVTVIQDDSGYSVEEAYIRATVFGEKELKVKETAKALQLIDGQAWFQRQLAMWKEGQEEVSYEEILQSLPQNVACFVRKRLK